MSTRLSYNLDAVARTYTQKKGDVDTKISEYCYWVFRPYIRGAILEIGPAMGVMTAHLLKDFSRVSVVEPATRYARHLKQKFLALIVHHTPIESFSPSCTYNTIIMAHVLEHLTRHRKVLSAVRKILSSSGRLLVSTPNANSLHRQAGVIMGILTKKTVLSNTDRAIGHFRVYTLKTLLSDIAAELYTICSVVPKP